MSFRTFVFLFLAFDLIVLIVLHNKGPFFINAGDNAQIVIALPWQKSPDPIQIVTQDPPKIVRKVVYSQSAEPILQPAIQQRQPDTQPQVQPQSAGPNTVYRCTDPKTGTTAFQSSPCGSIEVQQKVDLSDNRNISVPLANTQGQAYGDQLKPQGAVIQNPTAQISYHQPSQCDIYKAEVDQWRNVNSEWGRKNYGDALYRYNTKCR